MKLGEPEQEAVPVRCCCCGLDWITEPEISTDSTDRQKGTVSEDKGKSLLLSWSQGECYNTVFPPISDILGDVCALCVCVIR